LPNAGCPAARSLQASRRTEKARRLSIRSVALALLLSTAAVPAFAQTPGSAPTPPAASDHGPQQATGAEPETPEPEPGLLDRDHLLGDPGGLRSRLEAQGITLDLQETSEVLGNFSGGIKQGAVYEGLTQVGLVIDLAKAVNLPGATFNVSAYQIHGRGLSTNNLFNLNVVSSIEATRATRLFELWYEQSLFNDLVSVRVGQQAADQEFIISRYAEVFLNASFGWPALAAENLPAGGPAYPLATPGVRMKIAPTDNTVFQVGVYNGDPAGAGEGNPELRNHGGTSFLVNDGAFVIAELQDAINQSEHASGLPGTYKLGGWYNSNLFPDQRYGYDGKPLADPDGVGLPKLHESAWSLYGVADQLIWRKPGTKDNGIGVFARVTGSPGDQNLISLSANAGVTYRGILPGRGNDTLGIGLAYARISGAARGFDADTGLYSASFAPIRNSETVLEVTYQCQVAPWLIVQPDFQYVFNPAGGVTNPDNASERIGDAAVFGLRANIVF